MYVYLQQRVSLISCSHSLRIWEIYDRMSTPNSTCCLRFENFEGVQKVYYLQQEKGVTSSSLFLREANDDTS